MCYNKIMKDLRATVSKNLIDCRKAAGYTQLQLAEKLNYSDKAVSKWERGESLPDIAVLCELAELYGITLDYLVREHTRKPAVGRYKKRRRAIVSVMSCLLVWIATTAVYSVLLICKAPGDLWLSFVWALPVTSILCVVFSCVWGNRYHRAISVSALIWTLALALFLTIRIQNMWIVFVLSVPVQALAVFWFILRKGQNNVC